MTEEQARAATPNRGWLKGYVKWAGEACDCNLAYHLVAGLSVLTQTVPISYGVPFGALTIYAPLFGLLIGDSTDARKTTAINLATSLIEKAMPKRLGAEPGSAESIVDDLAPNPQQLVAIGEYGALLAVAERGYATAIKTRWTACYDCRPLARRKANGKGVTVETPRLSLLAGIAPGYIEKHTEPVDWTEGFLARHTTILGNRERYIEDPAQDLDLESRLVTWLKAVSSLDSYSAVDGVGPCLGFTKDAARARAAWERKLAEIAKNPRNRVVAPAIGRAPTMAIKIAGLLAWDWGIARTGGSWYITDEVMIAATKIVDLHVTSVLCLSDWLAPDKHMRARRTVLALVGSRPTHRGHIMLASQLLKRDFDNVIGTLLDEGTIEQQPIDGHLYYSIAERSIPKSVTRPEMQPDPSEVEEASPFSGTPLSPSPIVDPNEYD